MAETRAVDDRRGRSPVHLLYLLLAVPALLIFAYLTPPLQVPDEPEHYLYARAMTVGSLLPRAQPGGGMGGLVPQADLDLIASIQGDVAFHPDVKVTQEMFKAASKDGDARPTPRVYGGAAIYPPYAYAAPALALKVCNRLGLSRLQAFYVGRLANAAVFLALTALAIWLVPLGKAALATVFVLPMTIFQAASYSTDGLTFGLAALACALIGREALVASARPRASMLAATTAVVALVAMIKSPLALLAAPLAVLAWRRSPAWALAVAGVVITCTVAWVATFVMTEGHALRVAELGDVSASRQLAHLTSAPGQIFEIARVTLDYYWIFYFQTMVGGLGWLDTFMAEWFYWLALAVLVAQALLAAGERPTLPGAVRIAFAATVLLAAGAIWAALYLSWSPVGADRVDGVQGRYFIPLLAPLVLALGGGLPRLPKVVFRLAAPMLWAFWSIALSHSTWRLVERFYLG